MKSQCEGMNGCNIWKYFFKYFLADCMIEYFWRFCFQLVSREEAWVDGGMLWDFFCEYVLSVTVGDGKWSCMEYFELA